MNRSRPLNSPWQVASIESPVGPITIIGSRSGIRRVLLATTQEAAIARLAQNSEHAFVDDETEWVEGCRRQIEEYLDGHRRRFRVKIDLKGSPFQLLVWRTIGRIPFGKTQTYGEVARAAGKERAARAVGQAAGANPVPLLIPCHRVVGGNNSLGGFGSGLRIKRWLIDFESGLR